MGRLDGKVVIITGAGRGIGRAFAIGMAKEGAKVVIAEIDEGNAKKVEKEIAEMGGKATAVKTDITDPKSVEAMVAKTVEKYGRIDTLINNAAIYYGLKWTPAEETKFGDWERILKVNVFGQWVCSRAVFPIMKKQRKGKIINLSSAIVWTKVPGLIHYTVSKGAVYALTHALAGEWGKYGINVNTIAPGYTMSEASLKLVEQVPKSKNMAVANQCIPRLAQPEDIVGAAIFLASDESNMITGQTIDINGGEYIR